MRFLFFYETDEQHSELKNVIMDESLKHFKDKARLNEDELRRFRDGCYTTLNYDYCSGYVTGGKLAVKIELANSLFFEDLENAKSSLYDDIHNNNYTGLHDWVSDVQENLSFVPEIKVC
jgi:hypothetical protein